MRLFVFTLSAEPTMSCGLKEWEHISFMSWLLMHIADSIPTPVQEVTEQDYLLELVHVVYTSVSPQIHN